MTESIPPSPPPMLSYATPKQLALNPRRKSAVRIMRLLGALQCLGGCVAFIGSVFMLMQRGEPIWDHPLLLLNMTVNLFLLASGIVFLACSFAIVRGGQLTVQITFIAALLNAASYLVMAASEIVLQRSALETVIQVAFFQLVFAVMYFLLSGLLFRVRREPAYVDSSEIM